VSGYRRETDYFAKVPYWIQDHPSDKVDAIVIAVYAALYRSGDWNPDEDYQTGAFPSQKLLAERARCGVTSVKKAQNVLWELKILTIDRRSGQSSSYTLRTSDPSRQTANPQPPDVGLVSRQTATTKNPKPRTQTYARKAQPEVTGARLDLIGPTPADVLEAAASDAPTEVDPAFKRFVDKPINRV